MGGAFPPQGPPSCHNIKKPKQSQGYLSFRLSLGALARDLSHQRAASVASGDPGAAETIQPGPVSLPPPATLFALGMWGEVEIGERSRKGKGEGMPGCSDSLFSTPPA